MSGMLHLPLYITVVFCLTTIVTLYLFYKATKHSITTLVILIGWITLQAIIAVLNFYTVTDTIPPRFLLLVIPPMLTIIALFITGSGGRFLDRLDVSRLTILHIIRLPVELVLYWLYTHQQVPELMTFEGRNFDIFSGITAPVICYFGYVNKKLSKHILVLWNLTCLALLINIVANAVLSAPSPFQQFAFDQPNIAVLYFPFIWLPCMIVPLVLLSHLAAIRQLIKTF